MRRAASTIALKAYSSYTPGPIDTILGRLENLFFASSPEPKGQLTPNLLGSIRVTCRSKVAKIVPIGNPRWPPSWKSIFRFFWTERPIDSKLATHDVYTTSPQRQDVASTLRRRCINVMCQLGWFHRLFLFCHCSSFLSLVPQEGCASWLWYFLDIFILDGFFKNPSFKIVMSGRASSEVYRLVNLYLWKTRP